jgi:hypothetical protein
MQIKKLAILLKILKYNIIKTCRINGSSLIKKIIDKTVYVFITNMFNRNLDDVVDLYYKRWSVEECFKTLKVYMNLEKWNSKCPFKIEQEIECKCLAITFFSIIQNIINLDLKSGQTCLLNKCIEFITEYLIGNKSINNVIQIIFKKWYKPIFRKRTGRTKKKKSSLLYKQLIFDLKRY